MPFDQSDLLRQAGYGDNKDVIIVGVDRLLTIANTTSNTFTDLGNASQRLYADLSNIPAEVTVQARVVGRLSSNSTTNSASFRVNNRSSVQDDPTESEFTLTTDTFQVTAGPAMEIKERGQTQLALSGKSESTNNARVGPGAIQLEIQL